MNSHCQALITELPHSDTEVQAKSAESPDAIITTSLTKKQFRDLLQDIVLDIHQNNIQHVDLNIVQAAKIEELSRVNQILQETVLSLSRDVKTLKEAIDVSELRADLPRESHVTMRPNGSMPTSSERVSQGAHNDNYQVCITLTCNVELT